MLQRSGLTAALMVIAMTMAASVMSAATLTVTNLNDSGAGSLRAQLATAEASAAADNIVFQVGLSGTLILASELTYSSGTAGNDITIDGTVTGGQITVSGNNAVRCFHAGVSAGAAWTFALTNLIVTNGSSSGPNSHGAGVFSDLPSISTSMTNVTVANCVSSIGLGGGLAVLVGAAVTLNNCMFSANSSGQSGGGACLTPTGTVTITGCTFNSNTASFNGGGLYVVTSSTVNMTGCTFNANTTTSAGGFRGGGARIDCGNAVVSNCTFSGNGSRFAGGGASFKCGTGNTIDVSGCTFSANAADQGAGGFFDAADGGTINISSCTFSGNAGTYIGGGVDTIVDVGSAAAAAMNFTNCTISGNTCNGSGGRGAGVAGSSYQNLNVLTVTLTNCTIANNTSAAPASGNSISGDATSGGTVVVSYRNTIISGTGNTNIVATTGGVTFTSQNNNLCSDGTGNLIGANDLPSTAANLGALANNGGPTQTHVPQPGSAAIDKGRAIGGVTTDQRGVTKPLDHPGVANASNGDGSDIGAVEAPIPPTLTSVSPAVGPTAGGQAVTLTGTNFTGASSVTFAGTAAGSVVVVSSTSITCTTPSGAAGTASVIVTTPGGSNAANTLYAYQAQPTLTGVAPAIGPLAGGTAVTLTGTNFTGATSVTFAGAAATSVVLVSATSITCNTPAGAAGTASVIVTTPGGSNAANTQYTYQDPPTLSNVSPVTGPIAGGQAVTLTGANFIGVTGVSFGGTNQPVFTVVSATSITCNTPAHALGAVSVVVTTPAGANAANTLFTYVAPEMDVTNGASPVADGAPSDPLGNVPFGIAQTATYTITNSGTAALNLTGVPNLVVVAPGANITSATITTVPAGSTVAASGAVTFTITYTATAAGAFNFTVSIANDDANENPYNWTATGTGVAAPEIDISRSGAVADGGTDPVVGGIAGSNTTLTYTVANSGNSVLTMTLPITISSLVNCTCTVTTAPATATVAAAANETFVITIKPTAAGSFSANVSIVNDDANENPYDWTISGTCIAGGSKKKGKDEGGGCSTGDSENALLIVASVIATLGLAMRLRRKVA